MSDKDKAELAFLRWRSTRSRFEPRVHGISSDALVAWALGVGPLPVRGLNYPHDADDLGACERNYEAAPPPIRRVMAPVMGRFREYVAENEARWERDRTA